MTDEILIPEDKHRLPQTAIVKKRGKLNPIWILPIIAAVLGGWLIYKSYVNAPIIVTIEFESADGIEIGKTKISYKGMHFGVVDDIHMNKDMDGVIVIAELDKEAKPLLKEGTSFWLVSPQVSVSGVSGLETIISGKYIKLRPGPGKFQKEFIALKVPPKLPKSAPGLHFQLVSEELGSVKDGTTIYYHKIPVGEVLNYELSKDGKKIALNAHIKEQFAHLVRKNTRFWNASGVDISGSLSGFKVRTQSFLSMLSGGIAFDTPEHEEETKLPAVNNDSFKLFKGYDDAQTGIMVEIHFNHGRGLVPNETKVMFEGAEVGVVKDVKFKVEDNVFKGAIAHVMFAPRAEKGLLDNTHFWLVKPEISLSGVKGIETLLTGSYIDTQVQDLSKGKPTRKFVALDGPPTIDPLTPGLHFKLTANNLGSIGKDTTIYYKKIPVGKIHNYKLSKSSDEVIMYAHIKEKYAHLVRSNSVFYNVSGINISGGLGGIKLKTESLASIMAGGIAFYTPLETKARTAKLNSNFWLYNDYESAIESGLLIKITFTSTNGIKPESTLIKYKGLTVGKVKDVKLNDDLKSVTVTALLDNAARKFAKANTRFWIVRAKLGISEVSGLDTIITGPYIELDPGNGAEKTRFVGLEQKPVDLRNTEGLRLILEANELGSLSSGAPIYYKKVKVGEVEGYKLNGTHNITINIFIHQQYTNLVNKNTRFWNASGVEVEASLGKGVKVNTQSLQSIMSGGISFETPQYDSNIIACKQGDKFTLYKDYEVIKAKYHQPEKIYFKLRTKSLGSLKADLPVYYRQIPVGKIEHYELANTSDHIILTASVEEKYAPLVRTNSKFWNMSGFAVKFSLFGGKMETSTMESLLKGGIAFSTPNNKEMGKVANNNSIFEIFDEPEEEWLQWNPKISLDQVQALDTTTGL
jgi:paraquat-inducible protein B